MRDIILPPTLWLTEAFIKFEVSTLEPAFQAVVVALTYKRPFAGSVALKDVVDVVPKEVQVLLFVEVYTVIEGESLPYFLKVTSP